MRAQSGAMRLRCHALRDRLRFRGRWRGGGCVSVGGLLRPGGERLLVGIVEEGDWGAHSSHNFYVCGAGTVAGCDCVYDSEDVSLHHADEVEVVFALGYFA